MWSGPIFVTGLRESIIQIKRIYKFSFVLFPFEYKKHIYTHGEAESH
jgi:hypothetical protein